MIGFHEEKYWNAAHAAIGQRKEIEAVVDDITKKEYKNIFLVGIGGTLSYHYQLEAIFKAKSSIQVYVENAAELLVMGNKHLTKDSVVVIVSVSGNTKEIVDAVNYSKERGATIVGFINEKGTILAEASDYVITGNAMNRYVFFEGSLYQLYIMALRFIYNHSEFPEYELFIHDIEQMPNALFEVRKAVDNKAQAFATNYKDEPIHYLVAAGSVWGGTYSFAMCVLEESLWIRTKSIHAAEFFHGTLEVIDRGTSVILFKGEDETRQLVNRVENFVNKVCGKVTVFDSQDYELPGVSGKFRDLLSALVISAIYERIASHLEDQLKHPLEIRRYYKRFDY